MGRKQRLVVELQDDRFRGLIEVQEKVRWAGSDLQAIMDVVVGEYSVMPQANGIVVELRDEDQLRYAAASGTSADLLGLRLPLNASLSGMSILTGQPLTCADSETDSRVNRAACRRVNLRSMIVVPIPHGGRTVGVLKYYSAEIGAFTDEDILLAHLMVGPLAVGFSRAGEADAEKITDELRSIVALKERLISTVSHELRTPLTAIAGSLGLLVNGAAGEMPPRAAQMLAIAQRNAERLSRLINDLLTFEKLGAAALEFDSRPVALGALLADAIEQCEPYAQQAGARLELAAVDGDLSVTADGDRLLQAVCNLISNAAKFSPAGGTVTVALSRRGGEAVIRVADQGPGVSESFRKRLFQPFAQDDEVQPQTHMPSTGLGLAITRSLVEQMGGTVALDEATTSGAAFEIALPVLVDEAGQAATAAA